jgi:hypothetical protein
MRAAAVALLAALVPLSEPEPARAEESWTVEDLQICDCLLPGKVRKIGRRATYVTRRRPIETVVLDCKARGGEYTPPDVSDRVSALGVWLESAEAGDPEAQHRVGEIYEKGRGVPPDYGQASKWYRLAASQGFAPAQINLGSLYERGLGVERDMEQALRWYRTAAGLDDAIALDLASPSAPPESTVPATVKVTPPSIEVIEPPIVATRGVHVVPTTGGRREIVGRVSAAAGILSFTLNGASVAFDERGLFRETVEVPPTSLPCDLVAVDRRGQRTELRFELTRQAPATPPDERGRSDLKFGKHVAVVIGNEDYTSFADLRTAIDDAERIASILEARYGFEIRTLRNATRYEVLSALNELRTSLDEETSLLVYYAGHGQLLDEIERGYWLPVDAETDNPATWISTSDIADYLRIIPARHILIISDSCFSGTLTRSAVARGASALSGKERDNWYRAVLGKRARVALASGGLTPVLDGGGGGHSVFNEALAEALGANDDILEASRLYHEVAARVAYVAGELGVVQEPEFAPVRFAGHESGDFLFVPSTRP